MTVGCRKGWSWTITLWCAVIQAQVRFQGIKCGSTQGLKQIYNSSILRGWKITRWIIYSIGTSSDHIQVMQVTIMHTIMFFLENFHTHHDHVSDHNYHSLCNLWWPHTNKEQHMRLRSLYTWTIVVWEDPRPWISKTIVWSHVYIFLFINIHCTV